MRNKQRNNEVKVSQLEGEKMKIVKNMGALGCLVMSVILCAQQTPPAVVQQVGGAPKRIAQIVFACKRGTDLTESDVNKILLGGSVNSFKNKFVDKVSNLSYLSGDNKTLVPLTCYKIIAWDSGKTNQFNGKSFLEELTLFNAFYAAQLPAGGDANLPESAKTVLEVLVVSAPNITKDQAKAFVPAAAFAGDAYISEPFILSTQETCRLIALKPGANFDVNTKNNPIVRVAQDMLAPYLNCSSALVCPVAK